MPSPTRKSKRRRCPSEKAIQAGFRFLGATNGAPNSSDSENVRRSERTRCSKMPYSPQQSGGENAISSKKRKSVRGLFDSTNRPLAKKTCKTAAAPKSDAAKENRDEATRLLFEGDAPFETPEYFARGVAHMINSAEPGYIDKCVSYAQIINSPVSFMFEGPSISSPEVDAYLDLANSSTK